MLGKDDVKIDSVQTASFRCVRDFSSIEKDFPDTFPHFLVKLRTVRMEFYRARLADKREV